MKLRKQTNKAIYRINKALEAVSVKSEAAFFHAFLISLLYGCNGETFFCVVLKRTV